jgi:hypothetical protein
MTVTKIRWRSRESQTAVVETDRGYALATDLGVQPVPAWRARLFLLAESLFRVMLVVRPL